MLDNLKLDHVVFLDIETVSQKASYQSLDPDWKKLWDKKSSFIKKEEESEEEVYQRAGIYAEFGRVICISVGVYREIDGKRQFRIKSFYGKDEKKVLTEFGELLRKHFNTDDYLLCAHNGKEFDFPFLARRMLINRIKLPYLLDTAGRKPWEVQHLDTLQLWKFGDYKHYTSLDLLSQLFNIPTPKSNMTGADVGKVFWEEDDLEKIVAYCQEDTLAVAQLLLAYKGLETIKKKEVTIVP